MNDDLDQWFNEDEDEDEEAPQDGAVVVLWIALIICALCLLNELDACVGS